MSIYKLQVAGLERGLKICEVNEHLDIAAFIMFSDVELTVACAERLNALAPEHDLIITAESKGIPLAYEMSRQSGKKYILARKSPKLYMRDPVQVDVKSITTAKIQALYLDSEDLEHMRGKKILIVDDVISTGDSVRAIEKLVEHADATVVGKMAVLAEGDAINRKDIIYLAELPVFPK
ncbi:MAG: adenine phosphoribosyltransferase [Oscillospiraceae bacterium]|jgi:adenine phosphoribosyltransferase|nr:adenine phosphoribosyltransferase [Oscillospiraceae bacterium]